MIRTTYHDENNVATHAAPNMTEAQLAFSACDLCGACLTFGVQQFHNCPPTVRPATRYLNHPSSPISTIAELAEVTQADNLSSHGPSRIPGCVIHGLNSARVIHFIQQFFRSIRYIQRCSDPSDPFRGATGRDMLPPLICNFYEITDL